MPTVIDDVLYNAMLQSRQGALMELYGGRRIYPNCGCCISGNTVGIYKDPIALMSCSEVDLCTDEPFTVSFTNSYSATSTLQTWSVSWGDGNVSNGAWPPAATIAHPGGGYTFWGVYTITLTVTDLLGATGKHAIDVYVDLCRVPIVGAMLPGQPPVDPQGPPLVDQIYATTLWSNQDYWSSNIWTTPPTWNLIAHTADKSKTTMMFSTTTNRFFGYGWGIWEYTPLPMDTGAWGQLYTEAQLATLFGHGADYNECYIFKMEFSVIASQEAHAWAGVYLWWTDGGGDNHVLIGCLHTRDAWTSIQFVTTLFDLEEAVDFTMDISVCIENGLAVDHHSDTVYIAVSKTCEDDGGAPEAASFDGWLRLYRSQDFGYTFYLAHQKTFTWGVDGYDTDRSDHYTDVWVPWVSDTYNGGAVFWTTTALQEHDVFAAHEFVPLIYRSLNHGLSVENIGDDAGLGHGLNMLKGPWNSLSRVYGALMTEDCAVADGYSIYTWRAGMGWTLFRKETDNYDDCRAIIIYEQNGYALKTAIAFPEPYWLTSTSGTDKAHPNDNVFWLTWIPLS